MDPDLTTIGGSRKTDVGTSAIKEAALLECRNDRVAKGKGARLDFRLVITGGVGERVATNLERVPLGKGEDVGREAEHEGERERCQSAHRPSEPGNKRQHLSSLKYVCARRVRAGEPQLQVTSVPVGHNKDALRKPNTTSEGYQQR